MNGRLRLWNDPTPLDDDEDGEGLSWTADPDITKEYEKIQSTARMHKDDVIGDAIQSLLIADGSNERRQHRAEIYDLVIIYEELVKRLTHVADDNALKFGD